MKTKEAEKIADYHFVTNINNIGTMGIMDVSNQKLLCLCTEENSKVILHALHAQFSLTDKWISVEERLPEKEGEYNVFSEDYGYVTTLFYEPEFEAFVFLSRDGRKKTQTEYGDCVTHWQPLPAPPQNIVNS